MLPSRNVTKTYASSMIGGSSISSMVVPLKRPRIVCILALLSKAPGVGFESRTALFSNRRLTEQLDHPAIKRLVDQKGRRTLEVVAQRIAHRVGKAGRI